MLSKETIRDGTSAEFDDVSKQYKVNIGEFLQAKNQINCINLMCVYELIEINLRVRISIWTLWCNVVMFYVKVLLVLWTSTIYSISRSRFHADILQRDYFVRVFSWLKNWSPDRVGVAQAKNRVLLHCYTICNVTSALGLTTNLY